MLRRHAYCAIVLTLLAGLAAGFVAGVSAQRSAAIYPSDLHWDAEAGLFRLKTPREVLEGR